MSAPTTIPGTDGLPRCRWCGIAPEFEAYHDHEWGFPVADDIRLFEKLCLEGFQSGLSWRTILAKRENFRRAFNNFDFHQLAQFGEAQVAQLLLDQGIVRHRGKIEAVINNAQCAVRLQAEYGSLAAYFWRYEARIASQPQTISTSPESTALSKDLKQRGWKFVGPTTVYAFMQAMGLVNDHVAECVIAKQVDRAREAFTAPRALAALAEPNA
ncbi:DNA-3-methyladenine glycosylase I [Chitinolyticbacter meiyuanensis]|uniref:DNA-3-methyladenine glycosylase I n=1 Tax=Chitinolyticbacter meiyuanensis TaxID=682798 RepID=UPI0011E5FC04|nr:DNA-3-methyladenine glycosylase I [Chitinolyticbacter meiyuanensis]